MPNIKKEYERWLANATVDADVANELKLLDDAKIEDAFYRDLAFGTGGLRGVIGAGTNRMNIYTVAKVSQGLADYLKKNFETPSVAIGYDSRIKSDVFAKVAAGVFAANGVKVNIWPVLIKSKTVLRLRQKTSVFPFPPTRAFSGWNAGRNLLKIRNQIENPNLNRNSKKRSIGSSISLKKAI